MPIPGPPSYQMDDEEAVAPVSFWTPNPAVPPLARILAFVFGGMMLLTVFLELFTSRPPDRPPVPEQWANMTTKAGASIRYPAGWHPEHDDREEEYPSVGFWLAPDEHCEDTVFVIRQGGPVRLLVRTIRVPDHIDPQRVSWAVANGLTTDMDRYYDRLQRTPADVPDFIGAWHRVTCGEYEGAFLPWKRRIIPMEAAWMVQVKGQRVYAFVAITPEGGWDIMRLIAEKAAASISTP